MRKIEQAMCEALANRTDWKSGNTEVRQDRGIGVGRVYLHGNLIGEVAYRQNLASGTYGEVIEVSVYDGGWQTVTTKSRINAMLQYFGTGARVTQSDWVWRVWLADNRWLSWNGWFSWDLTRPAAQQYKCVGEYSA